MQYSVYYESRVLRRWKRCGEFNSLVEANELIDYLMKQRPGGYKVRFRIIGEYKSYLVSELGLAAA